MYKTANKLVVLMVLLVTMIATTASAGVKVYVKATTAPYLYAWNGGGTIGTAFPGEQMSETAIVGGETYWVRSFDVDGLSIILSNGNGNQTGNIDDVNVNKHIFTYDGTTGYTDITAAAHAQDEPAEVVYQKSAEFAYFANTLGWSKVYAYAYQGDDINNGEWPGEEMEPVGTNSFGVPVYLWKNNNLSFTPSQIIFSNGDGQQTADLNYVGAGYYTLDGTWSDGKANAAANYAAKFSFDQTTIPDERLRNALKNSHGIEEGLKTYDEVKGMNSVSLSANSSASQEVVDFTGLDWLTHLNYINVWGYKVPNGQINLDNNKKLQQVYFYYNNLQSIDLSRLAQITNLTVAYNNLTSVDLPSTNSLTYVNLNGNQLRTLDVSMLPNLQTLDYESNQMTDLVDISHNPNLTSVDGSYNYNMATKNVDYSVYPQLQYIRFDGCYFDGFNVTGLTDLYSLDLESNNLTTIDLSTNENLQSLDLSWNNFPSLDVTHNTKLTYLRANGNKIPTSGIDLRYNTELQTLELEGNLLTAIDLTTNTKLESLYLSSNQITTEGLNLSTNVELRYLSLSSNLLDAVDLSTNTKLYNLNISWNKLPSIDLTTNTELQYLYLEHNQLPSIDLSHQSNLYRLRINDNQLPSIDLSHNPNLYDLEIQNNLIAGELDLTNNTNLDYFDCSNNEITSLLFADNLPMRMMRVNDNPLSSLDYNKMPNLMQLQSYNTNLTYYDFTSNNRLANYRWQNGSGFNCGGYWFSGTDNRIKPNGRLLENPANNEAYTITVAEFEAMLAPGFSMSQVVPDSWKGGITINDNGTVTLNPKDRRITYRYNTQYQGIDSLGIFGEVPFYIMWDYAIPITEEYFPNEQFRNYIANHYDTEAEGEEGHGELSSTEILNIHDLTLSGSDITDLTGIGFLFELENVTISDTELSAIDLSACEGLQYVDLRNNRNLTSFNLGDNEDLEYLNVANCSLTSLDVTGLKRLSVLVCNDNPLTSLDLTKNTILQGLTMYNTRITEIDLSKNTELLNDRNHTWISLMNGRGVSFEPKVTPNGRALDLNEESTGVYSMSLSDFLAAMGANGNNFDINNVVSWGSGIEIGTDKVTMTRNKVTYKYESNYAGTDTTGTLKPVEFYIKRNVQIPIDAEHFPNDNLRENNIRQHDTDGDGVLDTEEIERITNLWVNGVDNLTGIEYLTELERLVISNTHITDLDLSNNTELLWLDVHSNRLQSLNTSALTKLEALICYDNPLRSLDLSSNTELKILSCYDTNLAAYDLSANSVLDNDADIQFSEGWGWWQSSKVAPNGRYLDLDAVGGHYQISKDNFIAAMGPDFDLAKVVDGSWSEGINFDGDNVIFTADKVTYRYNTAYTGAVEMFSPVEFFIKRNSYVPIDAEHFPNESFRTYVGDNYDTNGDNQLDTEEIERITQINLNGNNIDNVGGVEYFTNLEVLDVSNNNLSSLDVTSLENLAILYCYDNPLKSLDLRANSKLQELQCYNTNIVAFNFADNHRLIKDGEVRINENESWGGRNSVIEPNGRYINVESVDGNWAVSYADFLTQMGPDFDVTKVVAGSWSDGITFEGEGDDARVILSKKVTYRYNTSYTDTVEMFNQVEFYIKPNYKIPITSEFFPDDNFRENYIRQQDSDGDGNLDAEEIERITYLWVNGVDNLTGIEYLTELTDVGIYDNYNLSEIDLSKNTNLDNINIQRNGNLTNVTLPDDVVNYVNITDNHNLTSLTFPENSDVYVLDVHHNNLSSLDVTSLSSLVLLIANNNPLTSLDLSGNPNLQGLTLHDTKVAHLNFSENKQLTNNKNENSEYGSVRYWLPDGNGDLSEHSYSYRPILEPNGRFLNPTEIEGAYSMTKADFLEAMGPDFDLTKATDWSEGITFDGDNVIFQLGKQKITYTYPTGSDCDEQYRDNVANVEFFIKWGPKIPIDEAHFPDEQFRNNIREYYDADRDGYLDGEEAGQNFMYIGYSGVADITGLEYFYDLKGLEWNYSSMTTIDLSNFTQLEYVRLNSHSNLTSLNLGENENLLVLDVSSNSLTSLDVSKLSKLALLCCDYNPLRSLDLSHNALLMALMCRQTELTAINFAANDTLMSGGQVRFSSNLRWVNPENSNWWTGPGESIWYSTDLNNNGREVYIEEDNDTYYLSTEDFLAAMGPDFTMDKVVEGSWSEGIDFSESGKVKFISTDGNDYGRVTYRYKTDYAPKPNLNWGEANVREVEFFIDWEKALPLDEAHFPDAVFRKWLHYKMDKNNDWFLGRRERSGWTWLSAYAYEIHRMNVFTPDEVMRSIEGIQYLTDLTTFRLEMWDDGKYDKYEYPNVFSIDIESADFTRNPKLQYITMDDCGLKSINVSGLENLTNLSVSRNKLTSINVSQAEKLQYLYVNENSLTSIDVSTNEYLEELYCNDNELTALDVTNNTNLRYFECNNNKLSELDLTKNNQLRELEAMCNNLTSVDLSGCPILRRLHVAHNNLTDNSITMPDAYFEGGEYVRRYWNGSDWNEWTDTREAGYYLEELNVTDNQLTTLDLSDYHGIEELVAGYNRLTEVKLFKPVASESKDAPKLGERRTKESDHPSEEGGVYVLMLQNNNLTEIDLSGLTYLGYHGTPLDVSNNPLRSLDLSGCPNVSMLNVYNTEIVNLDLSNTPNLVYYRFTPMSDEDKEKFPQYVDRFDEIDWIKMYFGQIGPNDAYMEAGVISPNGPTLVAEHSKDGLLFFWLDNSQEKSLENRLGEYGFSMDNLADFNGGYIVRKDWTAMPADAPEYARNIIPSKLAGDILVLDPNAKVTNAAGEEVNAITYSIATGFEAAEIEDDDDKKAPRRPQQAQSARKAVNVNIDERRGRITLKEKDDDPILDSLESVYYYIEEDVDARNARFQNATIQLKWTDPGEVTAITDIYADPANGRHGEVVGVKYVNVAGMESDQPFDGVNIVVTKYSDGSQTTEKVRF